MGWTTPRNWTDNEVVSDDEMNPHVRDNLRYLKGLDGQISLDAVVAPTSDGTKNFLASGSADQQIGYGLSRSGGSYPISGSYLYCDATSQHLRLFHQSLTVLAVAADGSIILPSQPAFLAYTQVGGADVTGDGTVYTVPFETEVFDQGADFNTSTHTFTAPVSGRYRFDVALTFLATATWAGDLVLVTSNRNYSRSWTLHSSNQDIMSFSVLADMDAADTAKVTFAVSSGTKTVDVLGATSLPRTWFCGQLVA